VDNQPTVESTRPIRCAIYTRKSTEEGLGQEFNSLMAQREAAEAYIASQREQRWTLVGDRYDDGGFTGGNMDRPALKQLLHDIEAGQIDCVVVYKVDRLSRSLLDFSRIIGILEASNVSFVSVTQQFNTSVPLGRLTLNILLSFAQFEREIIGERTRDKIQAARRKGHWTGGTPVLGYDLDPAGGRLVINEPEADQVRQIFHIFAAQPNLIATTAQLNRMGWTTKSWTTRKEKLRPGSAFRSPTVRLILTNVLYAGFIRCKKELVPAQHSAIVDQALFDRVNEVLRAHERGPQLRPKQAQDALLKGLLHCEPCGRAMEASYTKKGQASPIRYYVCRSDQKRGTAICPGRSVSANVIERAVIQGVRGMQPQVAGREAIISRTYLESVIERISYNGATGRISLALKRQQSLVVVV